MLILKRFSSPDATPFFCFSFLLLLLNWSHYPSLICPPILVIFHSNCFPNHRIRLEKSASSDVNFPAWFPSHDHCGYLEEAAETSSRPSSLLLPWWDHRSCQHQWQCRPGWWGSARSSLALNRLFFSCISTVQTHGSSLGKTWFSTFAPSQQNERKGRKSPTPSLHILQFCFVCKTCLYGSAERQCPTFIPHIAQLKIHRVLKQGPCWEESEQAGGAAAPTPAQRSLATLCPWCDLYQPLALNGMRRSQQSWEKSMPLLSISSDKISWRGAVRNKIEGRYEIT